MDIWILEDVGGYLRPTNVVDVYVSFIWTERYSSCGDFEIVVFNSKTMRDIFEVDAYVWKYGSRRVGQVETVESSIDDEGHDTLTITGRSIEKILEDRPGMNVPGGTMTSEAKWAITDTPISVVWSLLTSFRTHADFTVPWINSTTNISSGNLAVPSDSVPFVFDPDTLYTHVKNVCDMYNLGFGILKDDPFSFGSGATFKTGAYVGNNRTSNQMTLEPVVFSLGLDSLKNIKLLKSRSGYKNVAYVFGLNGYAVVVDDNADPTISGYAKRILTVVDSSITLAAGAPLTAALTQRGKAELAKYRPILAMDGEIPQNSDYVYGVNYDLGDLVELRDQDGMVNTMNVVEQIFVSDKEGVRSYPTLSFYQTVVPGTWDAYPANKVWNDATGTWTP